MSDEQAMQSLTEQLRMAAEQQQWLQIQQLDMKTRNLLTQLDQSKMSRAARAALLRLQQMYLKVIAVCKAQSNVLEEKMALLQRNQEGMVAYTTMMHWEGAE